MLAAVSRDDSMLSGGISSGKWTGHGTVYVEPLARITASGEWRDVPCDPVHPATCRKFEREYLKQPHTYTVVSADGKGATIHAAPTTLDECWGFTGTGTYSGSSISTAAIAASSIDYFGDSEGPKVLNKAESALIRRALGSLVPARLDSTLYLKLYSLRLEGQELTVVQRSFSESAGKHEQDSLKFVFGIGRMEQGRFRLLYWDKHVEDDNQRVVGAIRLKNGREFLITSVNDSESHGFRVYGIRDGKLATVYSGGGSSC